jgi:signal transduction histidine kinase
MILADKYKEQDFLKVIHQYQLEDYIEFTKTVKVLYVDNDESHRDDFHGIFKIFFHDIDVASNGKEGLRYFQKNKYDLVITAIDMPLMNGTELIAQIRETSRHISVLVLSSIEREFIELIKLGVNGYLLLPVEVEQFVTIINKVIETLHNKQALFENRVALEKLVENRTIELQELNNTLEKRVKEEVSKNIEHEKRLNEQAKLVSMGEMLENIAHQWRQPLSVIATAATGMILQKECGVLNDDNLIESCHYINNNAQYLSNTIDDFRNFVMGDSILVDFNVENTINNFLKLIDSTIKESKVNIILDVNKDRVIKGFPNELIQCFINIFNNARDAFVLNNIPAEERYFFISDEKENDKLIISFKDSAGGIPKELIPKIFTPYFTTKHQSQGTGLGLYMSYNLITSNMKGKFEVVNQEYNFNNKKHKGAKFKISLPII